MKLLLAAGVLSLGAVPTVAQAPSTAQELKSLLTANGLKADVSFLASDLLEGRGTPSRGLDLASEYIAAQFRRAGLEPVGDDGYFQTANLATVTPNAGGLDLSLDAANGAVKPAAGSLTLSDASATNLTRAKVVRVTADDQAAISALTQESVAGKVLVVEQNGQGGGGRGRGSAGFVMMRGLKPAAVLVLQPPASGSNGRGRSGAGMGAGRPVARPREASALPTFSTLICTDAAFRAALDAAPEATISLHVAAPKIEAVKLRNVVGLLRGSDPVLKDTYLLVTGHYDHLGIRENGTSDQIYNGANDDASGTASVIAIANAMSTVPRPKRSVLFMTVFGEELGDLGSHYYAAHPIFPLAKTVVDLNLEQLGRTDDLEGPRVGAFNMTGFDYTNLPEIFARAGAATDIRAVKHEKNSDAYFRRSDNAAFADAGVPSTTISVAYDFPDYHKQGDEWQKLDYENMAKVDRTIALAMIDIANRSEAPKWDASNPKTAAFVKAREATMAAAAAAAPAAKR
ncbi:MAG TPA: M28 family peptidase [Bryobacteraceae bacterium]|nr:M28 family peptidase [Bryobacteraceae bacterium]